MLVTNKLINESSPYLLQHAYNPVDWYPWGDEAFEKAKTEDKPVFLSIGYSTCHWCHVMERESFESDSVAEFLNENFISIKVNKEERPDIDGVYMQVCMAMTGSGGWPLTILMTPDKKPFFAGTYLPKRNKGRFMGLTELLEKVWQKWREEPEALHDSANEITATVKKHIENPINSGGADEQAESAYRIYAKTFDSANGGFGRAPKFPSPHNLLFLLEYHRIYDDAHALHMVEKTLEQMYRGGIFDHLGYGFSRYSTDDYWLAPHFEKMLYDNAMLIMAYTRAYEITGRKLYKDITEKTIEYVLRELTHPEGGFYSAEDADSDGEEGKFYLLEPQEVTKCLGEREGIAFCLMYDITERGNFEGKSIPNLLNTDALSGLEKHHAALRDYRRSRHELHKDDKILSAWNGLMIAALARCSLNDAKRAAQFVEEHLMQDGEVFTSWRDGRRTTQGFLDDYACMALAMIELYNATLEREYLQKATTLCKKAVQLFFDNNQGGFRISGAKNEQMILDLKEVYDGAIPSGNAVMAYNMISLSLLHSWEDIATLDKHMAFMSGQASRHPSGHSFFWLAWLLQNNPPRTITCVLAPGDDLNEIRANLLKEKAMVAIHEGETASHPLLNGKTTYYICDNNQCHPPVNAL